MIEQQPHDNGAHGETESVSPAAEPVHLQHSDANNVSADRVTLDQSSAKSVSGSHVRVIRSGVRSLDMQSGTVSQSATAMLTATDMAMHESAAGFVNASRVDLFDSSVGILRGPVTVREGSTKVFLHIGRSDPQIRPVLSGESALKFGAGLGLSLVVLSRLLRRILGS